MVHKEGMSVVVSSSVSTKKRCLLAFSHVHLIAFHARASSMPKDYAFI